MQIEHELGLPNFKDPGQAEEFAAKLVLIFRCTMFCAAPVWLIYIMTGMLEYSRHVDEGCGRQAGARLTSL